MAVYDTPENGRHVCTEKTIGSLLWQALAPSTAGRHRLVIVDNASTCTMTKNLLASAVAHPNVTVIRNEENLGTARAINKAWKLRKNGEHAVKMDNDVVIHEHNWPDLMVEAFARDNTLGIIGFKRNDCWENPAHESPWFRSTLKMLPHEAGQPWIVVEEAPHIIGTCTAYNSALLNKIGYLYQMQDEGVVYGFDDGLACHRCTVAGMRNVFLPHVRIDHVDNVEAAYTDWKQKHSSAAINRFNEIKAEYTAGTRPIWWEDK